MTRYVVTIGKSRSSERGKKSEYSQRHMELGAGVWSGNTSSASSHLLCPPGDSHGNLRGCQVAPIYLEAST